MTDANNIPEVTSLITIPDEVRKAANSVHPVLVQAEALQVTTQAEADTASRLLSSIKKTAEDLEGKRFSMTRPLDASKKAIMDFFRGPGEVLEKAESIIKGKVGSYLRRMKDEQARIERESREKQAELDKKAREEQAAKDRLAKEAEDNKVKSADLANQGDLLGSLAALYEAEEQEALVTIPVALPMPIFVPPPPKVAGVSLRTTWEAIVTEVALLDRRFLMPNSTAISEYAKETKGQVPTPGLRFFEKDVVAGRSR